VRNRLDRLWTYEHEVLAVLDDFAVPFDNNQAERDLRPVKIQQQIAGTFHSEPGADAYCTLRSVLSTWRKQGRSALAALEAAFTGRALAPAADLNSYQISKLRACCSLIPGEIKSIGVCHSFLHHH
jgi:transposase